MAISRGTKLSIGIAGFAAVGLVIAFLFWPRQPEKPNFKVEPERVFADSSDSLKQTIVVPTLDTPITEYRSAVWCISLQLAWNRLKGDIVKEPVRLSKRQDLVNRLNQAKETEHDVPDSDSFTLAGSVNEGIVEKIQSGLSRKFPQHTMPPISEISGGYVAFGYVKADVRYDFQFLNNPEWLTFKQADGRVTRVRSFGLPESKDHPVSGPSQDQVRVLFREGGWFAVDLSRESKPSQILLAKVPRRDTLAATLAELNEKLAGSRPKPLPAWATLLVPNTSWRIDHDYRDLEGIAFLNASMGGRNLARAFQFVDFKMDRYGAAVESGAFFGADNGHGPEPDPNPERYHFDQPYLIVMKKRDGKNPFFVMWVDNAELLCRH